MGKIVQECMCEYLLTLIDDIVLGSETKYNFRLINQYDYGNVRYLGTLICFKDVSQKGLNSSLGCLK